MNVYSFVTFNKCYKAWYCYKVRYENFLKIIAKKLDNCIISVVYLLHNSSVVLVGKFPGVRKAYEKLHKLFRVRQRIGVNNSIPKLQFHLMLNK